MIVSADNDHIYFNHVATEEWPVGWYWADESEQLNGPYRTEAEATAHLNSHILALGRGSEQSAAP